MLFFGFLFVFFSPNGKQKKQKYKREIADLKESMKLVQAKEETTRAEKEALR